MTVLTLRTDKPEAELGLFKDSEQLEYVAWQAHRQLAETVHIKIQETLRGKSLELRDLQGIVIFKGPGSFTGLRIGMSVANALADSLKIPIVSTGSDSWVSEGMNRLEAGENAVIALPEYGSEPKTTVQKK